MLVSPVLDELKLLNPMNPHLMLTVYIQRFIAYLHIFPYVFENQKNLEGNLQVSEFPLMFFSSGLSASFLSFSTSRTLVEPTPKRKGNISQKQKAQGEIIGGSYHHQPSFESFCLSLNPQDHSVIFKSLQQYSSLQEVTACTLTI